MKSVYSFVVTPIGKRYNNVKKVGDKELIINNYYIKLWQQQK